MSWAEGSKIMSEIIQVLYGKIFPPVTIREDVDRSHVYEELIKIFKKYGCDTLEECKGLDAEFDGALDYIERAAHGSGRCFRMQDKRAKKGLLCR